MVEQPWRQFAASPRDEERSPSVDDDARRGRRDREPGRLAFRETALLVLQRRAAGTGIIEPAVRPGARCAPRGIRVPSSLRSAPGGDQTIEKLVRCRPFLGGQCGELAVAGGGELLCPRAIVHG